MPARRLESSSLAEAAAVGREYLAALGRGDELRASRLLHPSFADGVPRGGRVAASLAVLGIDRPTAAAIAAEFERNVVFTRGTRDMTRFRWGLATGGLRSCQLVVLRDGDRWAAMPDRPEALRRALLRRIGWRR